MDKRVLEMEGMCIIDLCTQYNSKKVPREGEYAAFWLQRFVYGMF